MEATEQIKPELLDERTLGEIEAEIASRNDDGAMNSAYGEYNCPCHYRLPALCNTVRAAWAERDWYKDQCGNLQEEVRTEAAAVTALREQLAEAQTVLTSCDSVLSYVYHRERSRLLPETQQQLWDTLCKVERITRKK